MVFFFFFLLFLFCSTLCTSFAAVSAHNRRVPHESFCPADSPSPSQPPLPSPPSPPTPYPFQASTPDNNNPFFPTYPSPPPPPSPSSVVSFPANISDINLPNASKSKHVSSKLIITAITCVLAAIVVLSIAICLHAKKRRLHLNDPKTQRSSNSNRLNHSSSKNDGNTSSSSIPKLQQRSQTSSEFLYLGTIVNSHGGINSSSNPNTAPSSRKMASPELRPLPPLNGRNLSENFRNTRNDDFYSTEESVGYIESSFGAGSLSRRDFAAVEVDTFVGSSLSGSDSSSRGSGSPSRSVSLSISPPASPKRESCSRPKSPELVAVVTPPPPQRPPPPPPPFAKPVNGPQVKVSANNSPVLISPMGKNDENVESFSIEKNEEKSEDLHWDKVRANSDREMVWDQQKSSSFKLNEEMIETLFVVKNPALSTSATARHPVVPSMSQENRVLDPKKSQNIAILLSALNVTTEEICEALLEGSM